MTTAEVTTSGPEQWNAFDYANKEHLLQVVRNESTTFFDLLNAPDNWDRQITPEWKVGDLAGHMVDVIEGYLKAWDLARAGASEPPPYNLHVMKDTLHDHVQSLRSIPRDELMRRLEGDFQELMSRFEATSEEEWAGFLVTHPYMGPVPICCYPAFQLMDYGVHSWDVHEARGEPRGLSPDVADFLVPFCFIIMQGTLKTDTVTDLPHPVGFRISGRNGGTSKVTIDGSMVAVESGPVDALETVFEFDPASFVLTTFGRIRAGTEYGNREVAAQFRDAFFET